MATKNTTLRNSLADQFAAKINRLDILAGATVLVTFNLTWSAAANGKASISGAPIQATASATGTADGAKFYHNTGGDEVTGLTVGTVGSGQNVEIDNLSITSGQDVNLNSCDWTEAAGTA